MLKLKFFILLIIITSSKLLSQTIIGSQIEFEGIDSFTYEVSLKVYSDCRDTNAINVDSNNFYLYSEFKKVKIGLNPQFNTSKHVGNVNDSVIKCDTANKFPGVVQTTYLDTIDFRSSPYLPLIKDKYVKIYFYTNKKLNASNLACASGSHRNSYNYATIYPQHWDSYLRFQNPELAFLYNCNTPIFKANNASPNNGLDSVSYAIGNPMYSSTQECKYTYKKGTKYYPFDFYDPSGTGYTNPNTNPPTGLYLDPETGDLIFTPTKCNADDNYVIEATRWRKDTSGKYQKTGIIRTDQFHFVRIFQANNPPSIKGPYSYSVCEESELCFTITTDDKPKATPGKPTPPKDSTTLWFSGLPPGVKITKSKNSLHQTAKVCITPPQGSATSLAYQATVHVTDSSGPVQAYTSRVFSLRVKDKAKATLKTQAIKCNGITHAYEVELIKDNFRGTPTYQFLVLDTSGKVDVDAKLAYFASTKSFISSNQKDTLFILDTGNFIVKATMDNPPLRCPSTYYDTINISKKFDYISLKDSTYCDVISDTLKLDTFWKSYKWLDGSNKSYLAIDSAGIYSVEVTDSCGVKLTLKANIQLKKSINLKVKDSLKLCGGSVLTDVSYSGDLDSLRWNTNDTTLGIVVYDTGYYEIKAYGYCGEESGKTYVFDTIQNSGVPDSVKNCAHKPTRIKHNLDYNWSVEWKNDKITRTSREFLIDYYGGNHTFTAWNKCKDTIRKTIYVDNYISPYLFVDTLHEFCPNDSVLIKTNQDPRNKILWSDGDTAHNKTFKTAGKYDVQSSNFCGVSKKSIEIKQLSLPFIDLGKDSTYCTGQSVVIKPKGNYKENWVWAFGHKGDSMVLISDRTVWLQTKNKCGSFTDTVTITFDQKPYFLIRGDTSLCKGASFQMKLKKFDQYQYQVNSMRVDSVFQVTDSGKYVVQAFNKCGNKSDSFYVKRLPEPMVNLGDDILVNLPFSKALDAGDDYDKYEWSNGKTTQKIIVRDTGIYWVKVYNSCGVDTDSIRISEATSISAVELESLISIYPNPSDKMINIAIKGTTADELRIYDAKGKMVYLNNEPKQKLSIDSESFGEGLYHVQFRISGSTYSKKLIIVR